MGPDIIRTLLPDLQMRSYTLVYVLHRTTLASLAHVQALHTPVGNEMSIIKLSKTTRFWLFFKLWKLHLPLKVCLFLSGCKLGKEE
jgi:hypothetical protein